MNFIRRFNRKKIIFKPEFSNLVANYEKNVVDVSEKNAKFQLNSSIIIPARPKNSHGL